MTDGKNPQAALNPGPSGVGDRARLLWGVSPVERIVIEDRGNLGGGGRRLYRVRVQLDEVRIFDVERERQLVAAIEFVSPANKDRPESRAAFVAKCAALLRKGVAVSVVDLVTIRHFNLYAQLMAFVGHPDPTMTADGPPIYAASCRWMTKGTRARLEAWSHIMTIGQPLPTLPLWLAESLVITLDLEQSYEQACHDLWIT